MINLSPELQKKIEQKANEKYKGRPDSYFPSNYKLVKGYIDGRSESAIELAAAEQQLEQMAKALEDIAARYSRQHFAGVHAKTALTNYNNYKQAKNG